jgi:hypothetical protein
MSFARLRPSYDITWESKELDLRDLEGNELYWTPQEEWVKAIAFDAMASGLYVLTEDDDYYFTCHSIHLEHSDTIPIATPIEKETMFSTSEPTLSQGKHAGHYSLRHDLSEAKDTMFEQMGQDLDTWQLIARDLARDIVRGYGNISDAQDFARDILNRLSHLPEMNIHPSELTK